MSKGIITLFFIMFPTAAAEKYFLELGNLLSSGVPNVPEYAVIEVVEGVVVFYFDNIETVAKVTHGWMEELVEENREKWETFNQECLDYEQVFKAETDSFNELSKQTEGDPIVQQIIGCEWDEYTDEITGYISYGNNGEDFIKFDMKTETWITLDARAENIKKNWDANEDRNVYWKGFLTRVCPMWLKMTLTYGKSYLDRKEDPSVSLLQRNPSSPVTCHATGFYPDKALIFWTRDGEEIHEGVAHGSILPNHDESFQMSVDLEVSSIRPEDWSRYDCVFQLSGDQKGIVTKLKKHAIKTNFRKKYDVMSEVSIAVIATIAVAIVIIITALGVVAYKKKSERLIIDRSSTPSSDTISL